MMMMHHISNQTACPEAISTYISNLTSSYTDTSNEPSMVAASVIMFVLAGLFFNLNLFSGISDISAILDPKVRLFLTSALSLFLPVMSYLFSEAKNQGAATAAATATTTVADLPLMAGLILVWMLLVELLRKKVDEIRMQGYSGTIHRAGRVVWLGNLVFFNIRAPGRKAVFSILWILCATKVLQRIAFTEVGKRSYAHGKNARLISSYMAQLLEQEKRQPEVHQDQTTTEAAAAAGHKLLETCKYIVMGEEKLANIEPTADGYTLDKTKPQDLIDKLLQENDGIVTVGKVWATIDDDNDKFLSSPVQTQRLKRVCVSFALFKLLRRRFDHVPAVTKEEARHSRDLILKGLYSTCSAEATFQVMSDEINFLSEYYHSVVPVVLASPFFLLVNYFLVNIIVAILCLMTVILCGNGDAKYALQSIGSDNYTLQSGVTTLFRCLLMKAINNKSPPAFFSIIDLSVTFLLFVIFIYEEIWEFLVFLLSNWFMVSLLYNYTCKPSWLKKATFRGVLFWGGFSIIMWIRSKMRTPSLSFRQFSVLSLRWPCKLPMFPTFTSMAVKTKAVPNNVKEYIMDYLVEHDDLVIDAADAGGYTAATPLSNGKSALSKHNLHRLSWACESNSVAEVILTWHIATTILQVERRPNSEEEEDSKVATRLSKYCAYLVAFHQELLPENPDKVELVFEKMKEELKGMIGCRDYFFSCRVTRVKKLLNEKVTPRRSENQSRQQQQQSDNDEDGHYKRKVVRDGVNLGRSLMALGDEAQRWKVLADVWTELIVFLAPSNDEERMKGHEDVLVQGGEFITVLWALTTHIGVSRPPIEKAAPVEVHLEA